MRPRFPKLFGTHVLRPYVLLWILAVATALPSATGTENKTSDDWIATWITANQDLSNPEMILVSNAYHDLTEFNNQTIREIIHTTIAGHAIRIRLDNTFGRHPVTFDAVYVGKQKQGASLQAGSNHAVTFGGAKAVTIPEGSEVLSKISPSAYTPRRPPAPPQCTAPLSKPTMFRTPATLPPKKTPSLSAKPPVRGFF